MQRIKINDAEIILEDVRENAGKIIVNCFPYSSSTYWGAMSGTITEFLLRIDEDYFANRLASDRFVFCGKITATNLRKAIAEFLPWYYHTEFQKEMRLEIKKLESVEGMHGFENFMNNFLENLPFYQLDSDEYRSYEEDLKSEFEGMMCEWWHMQGNKTSPEYNFYSQLLPKIQEKIKAGEIEVFEKKESVTF